MAEIIAALDEGGANTLLGIAIAGIPTQTKSGAGNLGPFTASYSASASLSQAMIDLIPPDIIRLDDVRLDWHLDLSFGIDLNLILPQLCLPQVCVDIPCVGEVCTPRICLDWPSITVPVSFGDFLKATGDFRLSITLTGGVWKVEAVVVGVPNLQFGATTALLLAAIGAAVTPLLLAIPFIGPFLAIAVDAILLAIGIAGVTGFLGPILTPFVSGIRIPVYQQPQIFEVLPFESTIDPRVTIRLDQILASVAHNGTEDELVLTADVSP